MDVRDVHVFEWEEEAGGVFPTKRTIASGIDGWIFLRIRISEFELICH